MRHLLLTASLLALGCAADDATPDREAASFAILTEGDSTGSAHEAWYQWVSGISYEAVRAIDGQDRFHHLDIMDYTLGITTPELALGTTYVDGPTANDRGDLGRYVNDEGIVAGDFPTPWIDLVTCDGDIYAAAYPCRTADRVEVTLDAVDDGIRLTYAATMPDGTTAAGSFVARPGTLHGDPE